MRRWIPNGSRQLRLRGLSLRTAAILLVVCALTVSLSLVFLHGRTISYFLRPIWDTPPKLFQVIPHYYAENVSVAQQCNLHGWLLREQPRRVFDAVIFSNELDLLEIRFKELGPYVTKFVLLESNTTFTGRPKPLFFNENRDRFSFVKDKLIHVVLPGRQLEKGEDPFVLESRQRQAMDKAVHVSGIREGDVLIMADVDELPYAHTIQLLQWCDGIPPTMHLQMRNYLHSFEFFVDYGSWRSSVSLYQPGSTAYSHGRRADLLLADAGWHCSFCFRHITDFVFKMQAYSHADRVRYPSFLDPARIQDIICRGADIFDMLPEEFTFRELIGKLGPVPRSSSGIHLPVHLLKNQIKFQFLLPGNCVRNQTDLA